MKMTITNSRLLQFITVFALVFLVGQAGAAAEPKNATEATRISHQEYLKNLPFDDNQDFTDAERGFIGRLPSTVIKDNEGNVVWSMDEYKFLDGETQFDSINPSLKRQAQLNNIHGLFKVTDRIYQVRGYDLSNLSIVIGDSGYIVIDPLTSYVTSKAAMELVYQHLGEKPIVALIYSHSHPDHWAGVKGVISAENVKRDKIQLIAPEGFMKESIKESIYAGNAMIRRSQYMFGSLLPRGPQGQVDAGLGKSSPARVNSSLIAPNVTIAQTGQELIIDGVRIVFQLTPNAEAPSDMGFYFPQFKALYMADNCVATLHNLLTPRGSQIRDARSWAGYIYEAIDLFGDDTDVVFLGHNWPRWGTQNAIRYMRLQADFMKYIHDQTLRLANQGYRPGEIAEQLVSQAPVELANEWFNRGYYATVGWNSKAVYQYYLGWFDGNPANFNPLPPVEAARKYVEFMGGADKVLAMAGDAYDRGEYRWVAQVVNHVVFADPGNVKARNLQADALEQLGYQQESGVFRNFYLFGAKELRDGVKKPFGKVMGSPDVLQALTPNLVFDNMAIRLNPQKAAGKSFVINWQFTDTNESYVLRLDNSVLNNTKGRQAKNADCTIRLSRDTFSKVFSGQSNFKAMVLFGKIVYEGQIAKFAELMPMLDEFDLWFNIVTP